ncbi:hypothetical protein OTU49_016063 [Cherax quadricarinatus]
MAKEELLASIEVYQTQLQQIQGALATADNAEKIQLQELQANLLQLLDLTLQELSKEPKEEQAHEQEETSPHTELKDHQTEQRDLISDDEKKLDDEFALFQSEIAALSGGSDDEKSEPKYSKEGLEEMVGTQCRSPFTEKWGGHSYHNAIVLSIVTQDGEADLHKPQVRVLFSQPTCLEMLPCRFFLSGRCKYSDDECRFSHGKIVSISDIKEHREPEYDTIVTGSRVLVQYNNDLWTSATVEDVLEDRSAFCVKYDKNKEIAEVQLSQMVPLQCDNDGEEQREERPTFDEASDPDSSEDERAIFVPTASWFQHTLSQRLGDWEKHTKGIGSKLMEKMGYVVGTGLGPQGDGRVEPVTAYVYPQGVSLDRCMELREASNGEELLDVEKRLDRERRKEEAKSAQTAERLRKRTSVFDIINKKLGGKDQTAEDSDDESNSKPLMNVSKAALQKDSTKDLNMKNYQLSENIRQLRKEVERMECSRERQSGNKAALSVINSKIENKKSEIQRLQEAEKKVQGEQQSRKDKKKFCVF